MALAHGAAGRGGGCAHVQARHRVSPQPLRACQAEALTRLWLPQRLAVGVEHRCASAARLAGLEEDIRALPMGMHTVVGDGSSTFSGGQLQRLLLAVGWQADTGARFSARQRHVQALGRVDGHLAQADAQLAQAAQALDLLAEELRLAHNALGEITGAFTADDLLGVIFSSFCIGK
jgi:tRNA modification GTPase